MGKSNLNFFITNSWQELPVLIPTFIICPYPDPPNTTKITLEITILAWYHLNRKKGQKRNYFSGIVHDWIICKFGKRSVKNN